MTTKKGKVKKISKITLATSLVASSIPFAAPIADAKSFHDVSPNDVHANNIFELANRGIIDGTPEGNFNPNNHITRAQTAKIIANILQLDLENMPNPNFKDIQTSSSYYPYIAALSHAGIIHGFEGKFNPNAKITRGQMAKIIARAFKLESTSGSSFPDVPATHEYAGYINSLANLSITTGTSDGTYEMNDFVTRAQLASFVVRAEKAVSIQTISGTLENITNDSIQVNGNKYAISDTTKLLTAKENREALKNAEITFVFSNNKIQSIEKLLISSGDSFNGFGSNIPEINIVNSLKKLQNLETAKLTYAVPEQPVTLDRITAKDVIILPSLNTVASINSHFAVQNTANLTISDSTINKLIAQLKALSINNQSGLLSVLDASQVSTLDLSGTFNNILLANNMLITGNASLNTLTSESSRANGVTISPNIVAQYFNLNDQVIPWTEAINTSGIQIQGNRPSVVQPSPQPPIVTPTPTPPVVEQPTIDPKEIIKTEIQNKLLSATTYINAQQFTLATTLLSEVKILADSNGLTATFASQIAEVETLYLEKLTQHEQKQLVDNILTLINQATVALDNNELPLASSLLTQIQELVTPAVQPLIEDELNAFKPALEAALDLENAGENETPEETEKPDETEKPEVDYTEIIKTEIQNKLLSATTYINAQQFTLANTLLSEVKILADSNGLTTTFASQIAEVETLYLEKLTQHEQKQLVDKILTLINQATVALDNNELPVASSFLTQIQELVTPTVQPLIEDELYTFKTALEAALALENNGEDENPGEVDHTEIIKTEIQNKLLSVTTYINAQQFTLANTLLSEVKILADSNGLTTTFASQIAEVETLYLGKLSQHEQKQLVDNILTLINQATVALDNNELPVASSFLTQIQGLVTPTVQPLIEDKLNAFKAALEAALTLENNGENETPEETEKPGGTENPGEVDYTEIIKTQIQNKLLSATTYINAQQFTLANTLLSEVKILADSNGLTASLASQISEVETLYLEKLTQHEQKQLVDNILTLINQATAALDNNELPVASSFLTQIQELVTPTVQPLIEDELNTFKTVLEAALALENNGENETPEETENPGEVDHTEIIKTEIQNKLLSVTTYINAQQFTLANTLLSEVKILADSNGLTVSLASQISEVETLYLEKLTQHEEKQLVDNILTLIKQATDALVNNELPVASSLLTQIQGFVTPTVQPLIEDELNAFKTALEAALTLDNNGETIVSGTKDQIEILDNNKIIVADNEYQLTEQQVSLFKDETLEIENINFSVVDNKIVGINSLEIITNTTSITGATIPEVNKLTVKGNISKIENVLVNELIIENELNQEVTINNGTIIQNITSNSDLILAGNVDTIDNINADNVSIQSEATNVSVGHVSGNITIDEVASNTIGARLLNTRIASNNMTTLFANQQTTSFKVTFADGDYAGKSLTINRKDTVADIQSDKPFTQLTIKADNFTLNSSFNLASVSANENVSYLYLNAKVTTLDLAVNTKKVYLSGEIDNLVITAAVDNPVNLIELADPTKITNVRLNTPTNPDGVSNFNQSHAIFYTTPTAGSEFHSILKLNTFGRYSIDGVDSSAINLKIAQLRARENVDDYLTTQHSSAVDYTLGEKFTLYYDTAQVIVYSDAGYSLPNMPSSLSNTYVYSRNYGEGEYTLIARARDTNTVADVLDHFILFDNGSITYADLSLSTFEWLNDPILNLPAVTIKTGYKQSYLENDLYLAGGKLFKSDNFTNDSLVYVNSMKALAKFITETPGASSSLITPFLRHVAANENAQFDSLLLDKYVQELSSNPNSYNSVPALKALIEEVNKDNPYNPEVVLTNTDLYLTGTITTNFEYSTAGVISNQITGGKLLFKAEKAGTTTLRVTDGTDATLLNVNVDANSKITYEVVKKAITPGTIVEGNNHFRFIGNELLPTTLTNTATVLQNDTTSTDSVGTLRYVSANLNDKNQIIVGEETPLTPKTIGFIELGFTDTITAPELNNDFGYILDQVKKEITFYAKTNLAASKNFVITGGANKTALHLQTDTITNPLAIGLKETIAESEEISITNDLDLSTNYTVDYSTSLKNMHTVEVEEDSVKKVKFFAGANESGYVTFTDAVTGKKTLVNVEASGTPTTIAKPVVLKEALSDTTGSIINMSPSDIVRYDGLTLYALKAGTTLIKLSDGKQFEVTVAPHASNNKFMDMDVEDVSTLELTASQLYMTNIDNATFSTGSGSIDKANGNLYIKLDSPNAELKVRSNTDPMEYTTVYITKPIDNGNYTFDVDKEDISASGLGLTKISSILTDASTSSRAVKLDENTVRLFGSTDGTRIIQLSDGTNISAINTVVKRTDNRFKVTPGAIIHDLKDGLTVKSGATLPVQVHTDTTGKKLYATGNGLQDGKATVKVPLSDGSIYVIDLAIDVAATKVLSFAAEGEIIFNKPYTANSLGLDTITGASVTSLTDGKTVARTSIENNTLTISTIEDGQARIQVTGTKGDSTTAITTIFLDKVASKEPEYTVEELKSEDKITFSDYGIGTVTVASLLPTNIIREVRTATAATFYALAVGDTAYTVTDGTNKAIFNLSVTENENKRSVTQEIAQYQFSENYAGYTGQIISGNSVRLSANKDAAYAISESGTTRVQLKAGAETKIIDLVVSKNANGHYKVTPTEVANTTALDPADIGLPTATLFTSATSSNPAIFETALLDGKVIIYGKAAGTTSVALTTAAGDKYIANIKVDATGKIVTSDATKTIQTVFADATSIVFLHEEDKAFARIGADNKTLYALQPGTIELLVTAADDSKSIYRVEVAKNNNSEYSIPVNKQISTSVLSTEKLGLGTNVATTVKFTTDGVVEYGKLGTNIYAYSKLNTPTTGATEMTVTASANTNLSTVVRLTADGDELEHTIFEQANPFGTLLIAFNSEKKIARYDETSNKVYSLAEGFTHATVDNKLYAIEVKRNASQQLETVHTALEIEVPSKTDTIEGVETTIYDTIEKITGTNDNIIKFDNTAGKIYATGIGSTQIKVGEDIWTVTVNQTANGKVTIAHEVTSSHTVSANQLGLEKITSFNVISGSSAIRVNESSDSKELLIYSNSVPTAQTARINVFNGEEQAVVNVVISGTGKVTSAVVSKADELIANIEANTTVKDAIARGTWKDSKINVYGLSVGTTALKFDQGIVNVSVTENANKELKTTATLISKKIGGEVKAVANNSIVDVVINDDKTESTIYAKAEGTAFLKVGTELYAATVTKSGAHYQLNISDAMQFFEFNEQAGTVAEESILNGISTVVDENGTPANKADDKLILYTTGKATGKGISDLIISSGGDKTLYHIAASTNIAQAPEVKKVAEQDINDFKDVYKAVTISPTDVLRVDTSTDKLYLLKEGTFSLTGDYLKQGTVSRDNDGYLTAKATNVFATLTEELPTAPELTNFEANTINKKQLYAKENGKSEVFLTENYRVKATSKFEDDAYKIELDERKMVAFDFSKYGFTDAVTVTSTKEATALTEKINSKIVVYASDTADTATITATEGTKVVKFTARLSSTGTFAVTPLVSDKEITFTELELAAESITIDSNDDSVATAISSSTGISFAAKKVGTTSFIVKKDSQAQALINVKVEDVDGVLTVTQAKPVKLSGTFSNPLYTTTDFEGRAGTTNFFPTSVGTGLYEDSTDKATRIVVKLEANNFYSVSADTQAYKAFTASDLGLTKIDASTIVSNATVAKYITGTNLYLFAQNDGTADVTVVDGSNKTMIVINKNDDSLTATPSVSIADTDFANYTTWSNNEFIQIRDNKLYTLNTGKSLLESTLSADNNIKAFMNINIKRKENKEFDLTNSYKVIKSAPYTSATVLGGSSVAVHAGMLYAQSLGTSTVVLNGKIQTVTVQLLADGSYDMQIADAKEQEVLEPSKFGVDAIDTYKVYALTGSNVVEVTKVGNNLVVAANTAGEAEIAITNNDKVIAWMHILVAQNGDKLSISTTPATNTVSTLIYSANDFTNEDIVRVHTNGTLYAKIAGETLVTANDALYKVSVTRANNKFNVSATPIKADLKFTPTTVFENDYVKSVGTELIAKAPTLISPTDKTKTEIKEITIDGRLFRYEVKLDGTISLIEIFADDIQLSDYLDGIIKTSENSSLNITINEAKDKVVVTPKEDAADGTTIFTASSATTTVQIKAVITGSKVELSVIETAINTLPLGFYPTKVATPDGTKQMDGTNAATAKNLGTANGLVRIVNDKVIFTPGEAGTSHFMITGGGDTSAIYEMKVNSDLSYEAKPFTETIIFSELASSPTVLTSNGTATAKLEDTGLVITLNDTKESVFVVRGEGGIFKTIKLQAQADGAIYKIINRQVSEVTSDNGALLDGQISSVNGDIQSIYDTVNNKTVLYGTKVGTGSFTWNNKLYNTSTTATTYAVEKPFEVKTPASGITTLDHMQYDNVAIYENGHYVAKAAGTGIYKTDSGYIELSVNLNDAKQYAFAVLKEVIDDSTFDDALVSAVTVVNGSDKVFVDGKTLYGDANAPIVVRVTRDGKSTLYKGTLNNLVIVETDLLTELGWSIAPSDSTLKTDSTIVRVIDGKLQAIGEATGTETITFTSKNGLKKTIDYTIDSTTYAVTVKPLDTIITFSEVSPTSGTAYELTFDVNVNTGMTFDVPDEGGNGAALSVDLSMKNKLMLTFFTDIEGKYEHSFTINIPELNGTNKTINATITVENINSTWKPAIITTDTEKFKFQNKTFE